MASSERIDLLDIEPFRNPIILGEIIQHPSNTAFASKENRN
jgi:hypothetical protein